jgi:hypothetical protein
MTPYEQYEKDVRHQGRTTHSLRMAAELARLGKRIGFVIADSYIISNYFNIVKNFENDYNTLSMYNNIIFNPITATIIYRDQNLKELGSIEFIVAKSTLKVQTVSYFINFSFIEETVNSFPSKL